uniref:SMI1/KNR4 family protein n=2 Tax=Eshraghiella crossota TaxID=45851 RepID=UPI004029AE0F
MGNSNRDCPFLKQTEIQIGGCEVDMMFEDLDKFIAENPEEVLVTGGWTDDKISELEKQLSIAFREEVKIFIRKYGVLIGYGVEIVACGRNGHSRLVEDTLRFRKNGLEKKYIVIEGDGELAYCLNNETGEIVNWGLDNLEVYPEAESLESFVLAQFKEGKMNW